MTPLLPPSASRQTDPVDYYARSYRQVSVRTDTTSFLVDSSSRKFNNLLQSPSSNVSPSDSSMMCSSYEPGGALLSWEQPLQQILQVQAYPTLSRIHPHPHEEGFPTLLDHSHSDFCLADGGRSRYIQDSPSPSPPFPDLSNSHSLLRESLLFQSSAPILDCDKLQRHANDGTYIGSTHTTLAGPGVPGADVYSTTDAERSMHPDGIVSTVLTAMDDKEFSASFDRSHLTQDTPSTQIPESLAPVEPEPLRNPSGMHRHGPGDPVDPQLDYPEELLMYWNDIFDWEPVHSRRQSCGPHESVGVLLSEVEYGEDFAAHPRVTRRYIDPLAGDFFDEMMPCRQQSSEPRDPVSAVAFVSCRKCHTEEKSSLT